jgi:hypothetical protein
VRPSGRREVCRQRATGLIGEVREHSLALRGGEATNRAAQRNLKRQVCLLDKKEVIGASAAVCSSRILSDRRSADVSFAKTCRSLHVPVEQTRCMQKGAPDSRDPGEPVKNTPI